MLRIGTFAALAFAISSVSAEACSRSAPKVAWNTQQGDQRVSGQYLEDLLLGKVVSFKSGGKEHYLLDGGYYFSAASERYEPNGYKFYKNGVRCLNYSGSPRYDLYVVNNKKLYLINSSGARHLAKISNGK